MKSVTCPCEACNNRQTKVLFENLEEANRYFELPDRNAYGQPLMPGVDFWALPLPGRGFEKENGAIFFDWGYEGEEGLFAYTNIPPPPQELGA